MTFPFESICPSHAMAMVFPDGESVGWSQPFRPVRWISHAMAPFCRPTMALSPSVEKSSDDPLQDDDGRVTDA